MRFRRTTNTGRDMERSAGTISDEAVRAATDRSWGEWEALLDSWASGRAGARGATDPLRGRAGRAGAARQDMTVENSWTHGP
ncbi:MAG TPA: hypothetical protein VHG28_22805 [Longimicrobiaceae bacterium]|nr:hypothetical protein [Longimicrobiaceae bacterium]